ncbi:hypothetical protein JTB14_021971 [Gonioctena quinquepunctata]|nr:hypothetical protein JTB14_021971 [Gonioctena quinquepunctata]
MQHGFGLKNPYKKGKEKFINRPNEETCNMYSVIAPEDTSAADKKRMEMKTDQWKEIKGKKKCGNKAKNLSLNIAEAPQKQNVKSSLDTTNTTNIETDAEKTKLRREKWTDTVSNFDFKRSSRKAWSLLRKLGDGHKATINAKQPPVNKIAAHIMSTTRSLRNKAHAIQIKRELTELKTRCEGPTEFSRPVTTAEITDALKNVNAGKAPGPDGIHPEFLLNCGKYTKKWLTDIMEKEKIPHAMKRSLKLLVKTEKNSKRRVAEDFSENNYTEFLELPYYPQKFIIEKNAVRKEYQGTNDERKFKEFQIIDEAIIAELRTLRDERAKDLSIQRRSSDYAKNRLRFKQRVNKPTAWSAGALKDKMML